MLAVLLVVIVVFITFFLKNVESEDQRPDSENPMFFSSLDEVKIRKKILSLHKAAAKNDAKFLTSKLKSSISGPGIVAVLNQKNYAGQTPLHVAVSNNQGSSHYEVFEILLKNGADPDAEDCYGFTPLWCSLLREPNLEILKLFFKFKTDFTRSYKYGSLLMPIIEKVTDNRLNVLRFMVQNLSLDLNQQDQHGWTPLYNAARHNWIDSHYEIFEFLLLNGADVNAKDHNGCTPLYYLVRSGNWQVVELFLNHQADVHAVNIYGSSILFAFHCVFGNVQVMDKLIRDFGLDVNHTDNAKRTPLHYIINETLFGKVLMKIESIKCFLKNGADINVPDANGVTPLISAVQGINQMSRESFSDNLDFFNFIIDQTDFGVAHKNVHILNYYGELNDNQPLDNYLWKWVLEHLAKLKFLIISIHPSVLQLIEERNDYKDYFLNCTKELEFMSKTKLQNSWITYFNLLVDDRRKLKNYAGNEDLVKDFESNDWLRMFPIYGSSIKKNVKKGLKRRELFDKSTILLSHRLPIFNPNHLIVRDILDCVLSKKDLLIFCD